MVVQALFGKDETFFRNLVGKIGKHEKYTEFYPKVEYLYKQKCSDNLVIGIMKRVKKSDAASSHV